MIRTIEIEGFKSIDRLKFSPGRVTVLIGENGCGKSNILEAIAMAAAAAGDRLDHEFLAPRGIRVTDSRFMVPLFKNRKSHKTEISFGLVGGESVTFELAPDDKDDRSNWHLVDDESQPIEVPEAFSTILKRLERDLGRQEVRRRLRRAVTHVRASSHIRAFLSYAPENSALRVFRQEGQVLPLGVRGEGLFSHLMRMRDHHPKDIEAISERLKLIDWFDGFDLPSDLAPGEHRIDIRDRYLDPLVQFDQRSANEGFLFLLFYYTLLISPQTPRFFAIDNVDASLNPRLCARLMRDIAELAEAHDKQVILTTHNPALLDGLDLDDPAQKLMVVSRTPDGPTRMRRIEPPRPVEGAPPMRLSEAFIWGHLGGLPTNF